MLIIDSQLFFSHRFSIGLYNQDRFFYLEFQTDFSTLLKKKKPWFSYSQASLKLLCMVISIDMDKNEKINFSCYTTSKD